MTNEDVFGEITVSILSASDYGVVARKMYVNTLLL